MPAEVTISVSLADVVVTAALERLVALVEHT